MKLLLFEDCDSNSLHLLLSRTVFSAPDRLRGERDKRDSLCVNIELRVEPSNRVKEWINMTTQSYKMNCTPMHLVPWKMQLAALNSVFPTFGGACVRVVIRLWLGVWLRRICRQSGGSEDVLAGPAFGGCVQMIVCEVMDWVRREKGSRQNQRNW